MDAPPKVLRMFVESTYGINMLHYTYGYAALDEAYVGYLYSLRIICLHNTYSCPTLSEAYVSLFYLQSHWGHYTYRCLALRLAYRFQLPLQNNWVTLHLLMRHIKLSLCWLLLPSELPCFT